MSLSALGRDCRIVVADPGLKGASGHNVAAVEAIDSLCEFECIEVYAQRNFVSPPSKNLGSQHVTIRPFFEAYFYDAFCPTTGITDSNEYTNLLARDYEGLFRELAYRGGQNVVLHHTMDWPHLLALGLANQRVGTTGSQLHHLVFLIFNPGVGHGLQTTDPRRLLSYRISLSRLGCQANVSLFSGGAECRQAFMHIAPGYGPYPVHPCFFLDESCPAAPAREQDEKLNVSVSGARIALYLGDAKADKGFLELPGLVQDLAGIIGQQAEFIVAYNLNEQLDSDPIQQAVAALERLAQQDPRLKLSSEYLSNAGLREILLSCDFLVLNYDPAVYAEKSSGLLWLAAKHNKPVVVVGSSWLTREAERLGVPLCVVGSVNELLEMIAANGSIAFAAKAADVAYRQQIFRPLGDFLQEIIAGLGSEPDRSSPKRVLFIDEFVPNAKASGGGHAAMSEIRLFQALGTAVDFVALSPPTSDAEVRDLTDLGVTFHADGLQVLTRHGREFDTVYVTRSHVAETVIDTVRDYAPQARLIVNVADLHFLRELRRAEIENDEPGMRQAEAMRENELAVLARADLVLTYSDVEKRIIESRLGRQTRVALCPWVEQIATVVAPFEQRRGIAYLGGFAHAPNVDAVRWFIEAVMPLLRASLPGVRLYVYGADIPPVIEALQSEDVSVAGFVEDVAEVYDRCRVFIAPLRYGAGLKGKVAGALARGVPCVLSPIAAEGFFSSGTAAAEIAETPGQWAEAVRILHENRAAWQAMSEAALAYGASHFTFEKGLERFGRILESPQPEERPVART